MPGGDPCRGRLCSTRLSGCSPEASAGIKRGKVALAPTQSPVMIAGPRRIATSLWLHFVASPQRMPIFRYRRWGRSVVNVIYRVPPRRRFLQHRQYLVASNSGEHPVCMAGCQITTRSVAPTRADLPIAPLCFQPTLTPEKLQAGQHRRVSIDAAVISV